MDQNSTNGTDKRSWRERLGIGAGAGTGAGGKDMPRIADEFVPPAAAAKPAVKPAPMAPRAPMKAAPRPAEADKLADKLKAQREAQEKLAEQRVQAAKQRAEIKPGEGNGANGAKPKFTFAADEGGNTSDGLPLPPKPPAAARPMTSPPASPPPAAARPATAAPARPLAPPPNMSTAPLTPPRQPLGVDRPAVPPRAPVPPPVMPQQRPAQQRFTPPPQTSFPSNPQLNRTGYNAGMPPYRPMDPGARPGYTPPSYVPPVSGGYVPPSNYGAGPRLTPPPASPQAGYPDPYGTPDPRARHLRVPPRQAAGGYRDDYGQPEGEIFEETRPPRRATAGDYRQAYRDAEQGYDEELPPSRGPWVPLLLLLLLAAVAGGLIWWLYQSNKPVTTTTGGNAPVVQAPGQPVKVAPAPAQQPANEPSKKLIYDRIVGDKEVLGGDVMNSNEVPQVPGDGTQAAPAVQGQPAGQGQEELVPLPIPPPPGDNGAAGQQGALDSPGKSDQALVAPAAGESQAAVPSQGDGTSTGLSATSGGADAGKSDAQIAEPPPMKSESQIPEQTPPPAAPAAPTQTATAQDNSSQGQESIVGNADDLNSKAPEPAPEPAPVKKTVDKTKLAAKAKPASKSLGSKPVVLVPPSDDVSAPVDDGQVAVINPAPAAPAANGNGGLYDGQGVVDPNAATSATAPQPAKKKKTLADLFRNDSGDTVETATAPQAAPPKAVAPAPAPAPAPVQQAAASGYVVQLSSFKSQGEANQAYAQIKARSGGAISGLTPIVSQVPMLGSTRYRLSLGTMTTREQASAVCGKLFAAGERDCLVRRQ